MPENGKTCLYFRSKDKNRGKMTLGKQVAAVKNYCAKKGLIPIDSVKFPK